MKSTAEELRRKLDQSETDAEKLVALLALVEALVDQDYVESWHLADQALELAQKLNDRPAETKAHEGLATATWKLTEYSLSVEHYADALEMYRELGDVYGAARCFCGMGIICGIMDEFLTALEYFEQALDYSKQADRPRLTASITGNIGHVYFNFGRYREAMDSFTLSMNYYKEIDNMQGVANMLSGIAGVHVYLGEYNRGLEMNKKALEYHKRSNHPRGIAVALMNHGITLQRMGKLVDAEESLQEALAYAQSIDLKMTEYDVFKNLSSVSEDLGNSEDAARYKALYEEGHQEQKKISLQRKNEQFMHWLQLKNRKKQG